MTSGLKIVLASWAPFIGGAEVAVERLAVGLSDEGHEVLLVVGTDGEALERFRGAGIRCEYVPQRFTDKLKWLQYRKSRNHLIEILRREKPDVVHSNDLPSHQMTGDAAGRLGIPRVCHHRWVFERDAIDWLNKYGAERHLFVSQALMTQLCEQSSKLREGACQVVYDGLPLPSKPEAGERTVAKKELGLDPDKLLILFAGQIIERKGVADLLQGWRELANHWSERAELYLVGDDLAGEGAYRREMERMARELKIDVRFMGFQRNIDRWLMAADVVMVPSHVEPLGNATLEAMSHARPIIGCKAGGIPEMIAHEQTGLLIPPRSPSALAAALDRLLGDAAMRERLGAAARQRCEDIFSLAAHITNVLTEYHAVLDCRVDISRR